MMIFKPNFLGLRGGSDIPRDGLVAEYLFSGNALDTSGNGNNGTVNGATLTTDRFGNPNSAYDFDGIDDYIDFTKTEPYIKLNEPFSISWWVYIDEYTLTFANYFTLKTDQASGFIIFSGQGSGYNFVAFGDASSANNFGRFTESPRNTLIAQWVHITLTYNGLGNSIGNYSLYINNVIQSLIASNTFSAIDNTINKMADFNSSTKLNGKLDDIRIYDRVLTTEEITALYNE